MNQLKLRHEDCEKRYGITWEAVEKRQAFWLWGLTFYSIAFPLSIVNALLFYIQVPPALSTVKEQTRVFVELFQ